jgi:hypothetical protein
LASLRNKARDRVRIRVSDQQERLKEQHAGGPHSGSAAEPWKDEFGDQRLHLKQEKCARKYSQRVEDHLVGILLHIVQKWASQVDLFIQHRASQV